MNTVIKIVAVISMIFALALIWIFIASFVFGAEINEEVFMQIMLFITKVVALVLAIFLTIMAVVTLPTILDDW